MRLGLHPGLDYKTRRAVVQRRANEICARERARSVASGEAMPLDDFLVFSDEEKRLWSLNRAARRVPAEAAHRLGDSAPITASEAAALEASFARFDPWTRDLN